MDPCNINLGGCHETGHVISQWSKVRLHVLFFFCDLDCGSWFFIEEDTVKKWKRKKRKERKWEGFIFFFSFFFMFLCNKFFLIHMRCPASLYATYLKIIIIIIIIINMGIRISLSAPWLISWILKLTIM